MKRARPPISLSELASTERPLLTTTDVATLLRVHPKHVYRLLRRGLPGHRVGGEWRFWADEVLSWSTARAGHASPTAPLVASSDVAVIPPLLAANGDIAVQHLLGLAASSDGPTLGMVQADRGAALAWLEQGKVLVAGCHGPEIPGTIGNERLAFVHLVRREVGLAVRGDVKVRALRQLRGRRLASRPSTAGVRAHFDAQLRAEGLDPDGIHASSSLLSSHREVVCAVARGEADVGLASRAWATEVGLSFFSLCQENYGLLVRASSLGDPRIVRLCAIAQSAAYRRDLASRAGYEAHLAGTILLNPTETNATTPS